MSGSYTVTCERSGQFWALDVPEVPGVFTQAANIAQIPYMVTELTELVAGSMPDRLRLQGAEIAAAFRSRPTYAEIAANADMLAQHLDEGFENLKTPEEAERLADALRRQGTWTCVPDDDGVTCTRQ